MEEAATRSFSFWMKKTALSRTARAVNTCVSTICARPALCFPVPAATALKPWPGPGDGPRYREHLEGSAADCWQFWCLSDCQLLSQLLLENKDFLHNLLTARTNKLVPAFIFLSCASVRWLAQKELKVSFMGINGSPLFRGFCSNIQMKSKS